MGPEVFGEAVKKVIDGDDNEQLARAVLPVIYKTLDWPAFADDAEKGYTEKEAIEGFAQFIEWLIDSKKKDESSPSSSASDAPSTSGTAPTESTAGSSSAEASSNPGEPGPSP